MNRIFKHLIFLVSLSLFSQTIPKWNHFYFKNSSSPLIPVALIKTAKMVGSCLPFCQCLEMRLAICAALFESDGILYKRANCKNGSIEYVGIKRVKKL